MSGWCSTIKICMGPNQVIGGGRKFGLGGLSINITHKACAKFFDHAPLPHKSKFEVHAWS